MLKFLKEKSTLLVKTLLYMYNEHNTIEYSNVAYYFVYLFL